MLDDQRPEFARLRERAGISIKDLAPLTGFGTGTLYRWERGEAEPRESAMFVLHDLARRNGADAPSSPAPAFTFADLFAGIGA